MLEDKIQEWSDKGLLFCVTSGGIEPYRNIMCPFTRRNCTTNCELYRNNKCEYRLSLDGKRYREIDNELLFDKVPEFDKLDGSLDHYKEDFVKERKHKEIIEFLKI